MHNFDDWVATAHRNFVGECLGTVLVLKWMYVLHLILPNRCLWTVKITPKITLPRARLIDASVRTGLVTWLVAWYQASVYLLSTLDIIHVIDFTGSPLRFVNTTQTIYTYSTNKYEFLLCDSNFQVSGCKSKLTCSSTSSRKINDNFSPINISSEYFKADQLITIHFSNCIGRLLQSHSYWKNCSKLQINAHCKQHCS